MRPRPSGLGGTIGQRRTGGQEGLYTSTPTSPAPLRGPGARRGPMAQKQQYKVGRRKGVNGGNR